MLAIRPRPAPTASILIVPIGVVDLDLCALRRPLAAAFGCAVRVLGPCALLRVVEASDGAGRRDASKLMARLGECFPADGAKVVGITDADLYVPGLSWVYGQAQIAGRAAIVSTHRLRERFHGRAAAPRREHRRLLTELGHEIGHAVGLGHCGQTRCCMRRSLDVEQIEAKGARLCGRCAAQVWRLWRERPPATGERDLAPAWFTVRRAVPVG